MSPFSHSLSFSPHPLPPPSCLWFFPRHSLIWEHFLQKIAKKKRRVYSVNICDNSFCLLFGVKKFPVYGCRFSLIFTTKKSNTKIVWLFCLWLCFSFTLYSSSSPSSCCCVEEKLYGFSQLKAKTPENSATRIKWENCYGICWGNHSRQPFDKCK